MGYSFNDRKAEIKKMTLDLFGCTILTFVLTIILLITALVFVESGERRLMILCVPVPVMFLITLTFLIVSVFELRIYIKIKNVIITQAENVTFNCRKVRLISYPAGRTIWKILGAIISDDKGHKYIGFFSFDHFAKEKKDINKKLTREIEIQKYCNSCVVTDLEELL